MASLLIQPQVETNLYYALYLSSPFPRPLPADHAATATGTTVVALIVTIYMRLPPDQPVKHL